MCMSMENLNEKMKYWDLFLKFLQNSVIVLSAMSISATAVAAFEKDFIWAKMLAVQFAVYNLISLTTWLCPLLLIWKEKNLNIFGLGGVAKTSSKLLMNQNEEEIENYDEGHQRLQALDSAWNQAFLNRRTF